MAEQSFIAHGTVIPIIHAACFKSPSQLDIHGSSYHASRRRAHRRRARIVIPQRDLHRALPRIHGRPRSIDAPLHRLDPTIPAPHIHDALRPEDEHLLGRPRGGDHGSDGLVDGGLEIKDESRLRHGRGGGVVGSLRVGGRAGVAGQGELADGDDAVVGGEVVDQGVGVRGHGGDGGVVVGEESGNLEACLRFRLASGCILK